MSDWAARRWSPFLLVLLAAACGGGPRPPAQPPPQTPGATEDSEPAAAVPAAETADAPAAPPPAEPRPTAPQVVIEPADPEPEEQPTLAEAAARERERRRRAGEPFVVITDTNLAEHAVGELTFMEDEPDAGESPSATEAADGPTGQDEQYWRDRVRAIRQRWAEAAERVPELEGRVAELRRRFYETDDAYYRDTRIKPAWDRAIDLVAQTRAEAEAQRRELETALEEGRRAGALPGWLREGIELEPAPESPEGETHEPGEPKILEPGEGGGQG